MLFRRWAQKDKLQSAHIKIRRKYMCVSKILVQVSLKNTLKIFLIFVSEQVILE